MSKTKTIVLGNGVTLDANYMTQTSTGQRMTKDKVKAVLIDGANTALCQCEYCTDNSNNHVEFGVHRSDSGKVIAIGCVMFNGRNIAAVKRWLNA